MVAVEVSLVSASTRSVVPPVSVTDTVEVITAGMSPVPTLTVFAGAQVDVQRRADARKGIAHHVHGIVATSPIIVVEAMVASNVEWMSYVSWPGPPMISYELIGPNDVKSMPPSAPPGPVIVPRTGK